MSYTSGIKQQKMSDLYQRSGTIPKLGGDPVKSTAGALGSYILSGITGVNPVAGMMVVLGTQLLGGLLSKDEEQELTPEQKMYNKRMKYFSRLGKSRNAMKSLASGMTGKPKSYFDSSIGKSDLSDVIGDETKYAKHIAIADSDEV